LTPLELEQDRAKASFTPYFAGKDYRILWGTESVRVDFSSAPADVRAAHTASAGPVSGAPVQVPRAYYGTVGADGTVSQDVVDVPIGAAVIEIGEYRSELPSGLTPELWALDQRAARHHFYPLVRIPLQRFDPPPQPAEAIQVELWWRLWNLGLIGQWSVPPTSPEHARDSAYYRGPDRVFSAANQIAKPQWNLVRARLEPAAPPDTDHALMTDLLLHHDRQGSPR
jgi:hypothetical protein